MSRSPNGAPEHHWVGYTSEPHLADPRPSASCGACKEDHMVDTKNSQSRPMNDQSWPWPIGRVVIGYQQGLAAEDDRIGSASSPNSLVRHRLESVMTFDDGTSLCFDTLTMPDGSTMTTAQQRTAEEPTRDTVVAILDDLLNWTVNERPESEREMVNARSTILHLWDLMGTR